MTIRTAMRAWSNRPTREERAIISLQSKMIEDKKVEDNLKKIEYQKRANEESAQVRALRKQVDLLEDLLDKSYNQIQEQSKIISSHREGDWMDKLIDKGLDVVDNVFATPKKTIDITPTYHPSSKNTTPSEDVKNIETKQAEINKSPEGYTSEQIKSLINGFDMIDIQKGSNVPYFMFSNGLKKHYPNATQSNILEAYELVQERAKNGK